MGISLQLQQIGPSALAQAFCMTLGKLVSLHLHFLLGNGNTRIVVHHGTWGAKENGSHVDSQHRLVCKRPFDFIYMYFNPFPVA